MFLMLIHKKKKMAIDANAAGDRLLEIIFFSKKLSTIILKKPKTYRNYFDGEKIRSRVQPSEYRVYRIDKIGGAATVYWEMSVTEIARFPVSKAKQQDYYRDELNELLEGA